MKKAVLIPLLLPLLAYAAVKGFIWFQVQQAAQHLKQRIQPFATLEYDRIESTILTRGLWSAALVNVQLQLSGSAFPVNIDRIELRSSREHWLYILQQGTSLDKGQLPHQAHLHIQGMSIDMEAPEVQQLMLLGAAGGGQGVAAAGPSWMGCELDPQELTSLLGRYLLIDISLSYRFDPQSEYANLQLELALQQLFSTRLTADVDLGTAVLNRQQLQQLQPRLGSMSLHYEDQGYNPRFISRCAELNNESEAEFIERHLTELNNVYQAMGLQYPPSLMDAYRQFLQRAGQFSLSIDFPQTPSLEGLGEAPAALFENLDIRLSINAQSIDTSAFGWDPTPKQRSHSASAATLSGSEGGASSDSGAETEDSARSASPHVQESLKPTESATSSPVVAAVPGRSFQQTSLSALESYLGFEVRLVTYNGRVISGKVARVDNERIVVRRVFSGGTADLPLRFDRIRVAEVKR